MDEFSLARRCMVQDQIIRRGIRDPGIIDALEKIPRHLFVPTSEVEWAYGDGPLPIGEGQTISQPYIVALMTELLDVRPGSAILEIGTGSGYQAAVLGELAGEVNTVERIPELAKNARELLEKLGYANVHVHIGDGSAGWPEAGPYDGILVAAAAPRVPPPLLDQLAEDGKLVLPIGAPGMQILEVHKRVGGKFQCDRNIPVAFVPLRGEFGWR